VTGPIPAYDLAQPRAKLATKTGTPIAMNGVGLAYFMQFPVACQYGTKRTLDMSSFTMEALHGNFCAVRDGRVNAFHLTFPSKTTVQSINFLILPTRDITLDAVVTKTL
jgi:hypothetical protein